LKRLLSFLEFLRNQYPKDDFPTEFKKEIDFQFKRTILEHWIGDTQSMKPYVDEVVKADYDYWSTGTATTATTADGSSSSDINKTSKITSETSKIEEFYDGDDFFDQSMSQLLLTRHENELGHPYIECKNEILLKAFGGDNSANELMTNFVQPVLSHCLLDIPNSPLSMTFKQEKKIILKKVDPFENVMEDVHQQTVEVIRKKWMRNELSDNAKLDLFNVLFNSRNNVSNASKEAMDLFLERFKRAHCIHGNKDDGQQQLMSKSSDMKGYSLLEYFKEIPLTAKQKNRVALLVIQNPSMRLKYMKEWTFILDIEKELIYLMSPPPPLLHQQQPQSQQQFQSQQRFSTHDQLHK